MAHFEQDFPLDSLGDREERGVRTPETDLAKKTFALKNTWSREFGHFTQIYRHEYIRLKSAKDQLSIELLDDKYLLYLPEYPAVWLRTEQSVAYHIQQA